MPYLTPKVPRWVPEDESAIATAAQAGLLVESHYLDLKESIPGGSGKNRELARDLASFAIDGGALLVGLAERNDGPPELAPVALAGLAGGSSRSPARYPILRFPSPGPRSPPAHRWATATC